MEASAELRPIDRRRGGIIRAVVGLGKPIKLLWSARGTESLQTLRWRKRDSKRRSLSQNASVFAQKGAAKEVDRSGLEPPHHLSGTEASKSRFLQRRIGRTSNPAFAVHDRPYVRGRPPWFRSEDPCSYAGRIAHGWAGTWFDTYSGRAANRWLLVMRSDWDLRLPAVVPELLKAADPQARRVPSCHSRPPGGAGRRYRRNCAGRA